MEMNSRFREAEAVLLFDEDSAELCKTCPDRSLDVFDIVAF